MTMSTYIAAGLALFAGAALGFIACALICAARGYDSDDAESDRARINFLSTEPVQIVTASGWVFAYDTRDQVQIGAGRNVREVIDAASANLLARAMAEADKKVI